MSFDKQAASMKREDVVDLLASHHDLRQSHAALSSRVAELTRQLEWFKQQTFGRKSERRLLDPDARQFALGEWGAAEALNRPGFSGDPII